MRRKYLLLCRTLFLMMLFLSSGSCNNFRSHTNPTTPQREEEFSNFYAVQASDDGYGVYKGSEHFLIQAPEGEYLLTYTTMRGTFYLVFQTTDTAILHIGVTPGDEVKEATLYSGTVTDRSQPEVSGPVTLFSRHGASVESWETLFAKQPDTDGLLMIGGVGVVYTPGSTIELHIPNAGRYLFTYITTIGTFKHEFQTTGHNEIERIGLHPGVEVLEAYILEL